MGLKGCVMNGGEGNTLGTPVPPPVMVKSVLSDEGEEASASSPFFFVSLTTTIRCPYMYNR